MPRKLVREAKDILSILKGLRIFNPDGTLKKKLHEDKDGYRVWYDASKKLPPMTAQHLYILVFRNGHELHDDLFKHHFPKLVTELKQPNEQRRSNNPAEIHDPDNSTAHNNSSVTSIEEKDVLPDEYETLIRMKMNILFFNIIQEIRLRPFSVTLRSVEHTETFKMLVTANSHIGMTVIDSNAPRITLKHRTSNKNHTISMVSKHENQLVILCQLISEKVKYSDVKYLLLDFLKEEVMYLPVEFNIGYDEELLKYVCLALNTCTFDEYNVQTFKYVENSKGALPPVLLNVDLVSILMIVDKSQHLDTVLPDSRKFYLKCIISLHFTRNLKEFDSIVSGMITCLLSPYATQNVTNEENALLIKIKDDKVMEVYNKFEYYKNNNFDNNFNVFLKNKKSEKLKILQYVEDLKAKVPILNDVDEPNSLGCPEWYDEEFKFLLSSCTSWTSLILRNADVDFTFNAVREQQKLQINPNNFTSYLTNTIEHSKESMRNAKSIINNRKRKPACSVKKKLKSIPGNEESHSLKKKLNENFIFNKCEENWGGKNHCYKAAKKVVSQAIENDFLTKSEEIEQVEIQNYDVNVPSIKESVVSNAPDEVCLKENVAVGKIDLSDVQQNSVPTADDFSIDVNVSSITDSIVFKALDEVYLEENMAIGKINSSDVQQNRLHNDDNFSIESMAIIHVDALHNVNNCLHNNEITNILENDKTALISTAQSLNQNDKLLSSSSLPNSPSGVIMTSNCEKSKDGFKSEADSILKVYHDHSYLSVTDSEKESSATDTIIETSNFTLLDKQNQIFDLADYEVTYKDSTIRTLPSVQPSALSKNHTEYVSVKKVKSKYIRAAPNIALMHSQVSKNNGNQCLIRNAASGLAARSVNKTRFTIEDSSKFDVFAEVFSFACINYNCFQKTILNDEMCTPACNNKCFFQIVKQFCIDGLATTMYDGRAHLLHKFGKADSDNNVINIDKKMSHFFKNMLGSHFSFGIGVGCSFCDGGTYFTENVINLTIFSSEQLSDLEITLNLYFETIYRTSHNLCKNCSASTIDNITAYYYWGNYLCIDIYNSNIKEFVNAPPQYVNVPKNENELQHTFALVGVVTPDSHSNPMPVAYCQTLENHWDRRNGKAKKIFQVNKLPKKRIMLLIYIRITEDEIHKVGNK